MTNTMFFTGGSTINPGSKTYLTNRLEDDSDWWIWLIMTNIDKSHSNRIGIRWWWWWWWIRVPWSTAGWLGQTPHRLRAWAANPGAGSTPTVPKTEHRLYDSCGASTTTSATRVSMHIKMQHHTHKKSDPKSRKAQTITVTKNFWNVTTIVMWGWAVCCKFTSKTLRNWRPYPVQSGFLPHRPATGSSRCPNPEEHFFAEQSVVKGTSCWDMASTSREWIVLIIVWHYQT